MNDDKSLVPMNYKEMTEFSKIVLKSQMFNSINIDSSRRSIKGGSKPPTWIKDNGCIDHKFEKLHI